MGNMMLCTPLPPGISAHSGEVMDAIPLGRHGGLSVEAIAMHDKGAVLFRKHQEMCERRQAITQRSDTGAKFAGVCPK